MEPAVAITMSEGRPAGHQGTVPFQPCKWEVSGLEEISRYLEPELVSTSLVNHEKVPSFPKSNGRARVY
jgi:hypothetical protein